MCIRSTWKGSTVIGNASCRRKIGYNAETKKATKCMFRRLEKPERMSDGFTECSGLPTALLYLFTIILNGGAGNVLELSHRGFAYA